MRTVWFQRRSCWRSPQSGQSRVISFWPCLQCQSILSHPGVWYVWLRPRPRVWGISLGRSYAENGHRLDWMREICWGLWLKCSFKSHRTDLQDCTLTIMHQIMHPAWDRIHTSSLVSIAHWWTYVTSMNLKSQTLVMKQSPSICTKISQGEHLSGHVN